MIWELDRVVRDAMADSARAESVREVRAQLRADPDGALRRFRLSSGAGAGRRSQVAAEGTRRYGRTLAREPVKA